VEAIDASESDLAAYVDPHPCAWLTGVDRYASDNACDDSAGDGFVLGLGAVSPDGLAMRLALFEQYKRRGWTAPTIVHPTGFVSESAILMSGATVLAGAVVQPGAEIGEAAIVNTAAVVEHDSKIGSGAHVAPGAIILGGAIVGAGAMVGAGAAVMPGTKVPPGAMVAALYRYTG